MPKTKTLTLKVSEEFAREAREFIRNLEPTEAYPVAGDRLIALAKYAHRGQMLARQRRHKLLALARKAQRS